MNERVDVATIKAVSGFLGIVFWAFIATAAYTGYQHGIDYVILNLLIAMLVRQVRNEVAAFGIFNMLMGSLMDVSGAAVRKLEKAKRHGDGPAPDFQDDEYAARVSRGTGRE